MGERKAVPLETAEQAVRISEMESAFQYQSQSVRAAVENMSSTLSSVQAEVRRSVDELHKLALAHASSEADRQAISRLESNFAEFNKRLEDWLNDRDRLDSQRWQAHDRLTDEYRARNEAENEDNFRKVHGRIENSGEKIGAIERKISLWNGIIISFTILASTVVGGFMYVQNARFSQHDAGLQIAREAAEANRLRIENLKDRQHQTELFLARRGYNPDAAANEEESPP